MHREQHRSLVSVLFSLPVTLTTHRDIGGVARNTEKRLRERAQEMLAAQFALEDENNILRQKILQLEQEK